MTDTRDGPREPVGAIPAVVGCVDALVADVRGAGLAKAEELNPELVDGVDPLADDPKADDPSGCNALGCEDSGCEPNGAALG